MNIIPILDFDGQHSIRLSLSFIVRQVRFKVYDYSQPTHA